MEKTKFERAKELDKKIIRLKEHLHAIDYTMEMSTEKCIKLSLSPVLKCLEDIKLEREFLVMAVDNLMCAYIIKLKEKITELETELEKL
jgi:hypothetical protein